MDTIGRQFRSAITAAFANRLALTVTLILVIELNPARAFAQGTWTQTAPDPNPRWWSAASQFEGVITVAGGFSPTSGNLTGVEIFPGGCGGWCAKPSLPNGPQTGAAAGTDFSPSLNSSTFEVAGGNNGIGPVAKLSIMEIPFVWTTGPWPSMPTARENAANLSGSSAPLAVVGGNTGSGVTGALEIYDASTNSWTSEAPMPTPRSNLGGTGGYVIGGRDNSGAVLATNEFYDSATNTWTTKASMPTPRADLAVVAFNELIYAIGGRGTDGSPLATVEVYDPTTDTWTTAPPMPTARWGLVAVAASVSCGVCAPGPAIYAIGGALDAAGTIATGANEYFSLPTPTPTPTPTATPTPTCGQVSVSPTSLSFEAGKEGKQTVKVTNTGSLNVHVISAEVTNTIRKDFTVSEDKCSGTTLASGGSCNVSVSFDGTIHQATGTLTITDTACNSPQTIGLQDVNFR
jgi:hypothetical protein